MTEHSASALCLLAFAVCSGCRYIPANHMSAEPTTRVWTEEHRGHLYVFRGYHDGHFLHSPECKCHATGEEGK
jgi:hypothetical protein